MDTGGLLGPKYSFADELKTPSEIGVKRGGGVEEIMRAVGGMNYYVDAIGFGQNTFLTKLNKLPDQKPLGIQYFIKTGKTCDNGADMYEYISTVPSGLPGRVGKEIQKTLEVEFRGLAPGIIEDAAGALNPMPLFQAVAGDAYAKCKKVTLPVGNLEGHVASRLDPKNVWITDDYKTLPVSEYAIRTYGLKGGVRPHQTRWVLDKLVNMETYDKAPKTERAGVLPKTEGFRGTGEMDENIRVKIAAGVLLAAIVIGFMTLAKK